MCLHKVAREVSIGVTKSEKQCDNCASLNINDAAKLVPQSLYLFISVLFTGESGQTDEYADDTNIRLFLCFGNTLCKLSHSVKPLPPNMLASE